MSKSQQELYQSFSSELTELAQIYNSPLFSTLGGKDQMFQLDGSSNEQQMPMTTTTMAASVLLTPLYQFQQTTIELQQREIEQLRLKLANLTVKFDENQLELDTCHNNLSLKVIQCFY